MSETKRLYIQGLENHTTLVEETTAMSIWTDRVLSGRVDGNEDFAAAFAALGDGALALGSGLWSITSWTGGKVISTMGKVLGGTGNLLSSAFSDNDVLIKKIVTAFANDGEKTIEVSASRVNLITSEGDLDSFERDMDTLIETLDLIDKHAKDIINSMDTRMNILRDLRRVKSTEDVFKVIDKYEAVGYPVLAFKHHHRDDSYTSDVLPNGKVFSYEEGGKKYLMSGDSPKGSENSLIVSKSDVSRILNKLEKVNGMHKRFKSNYDSYLSFIRTWSEMVRSVESNLGSNDKVSKAAMAKAEGFLGGDSSVLAFYSGFTPRVVSYTDRYIHGVLGVFA